jgi:hypothetical protein
MSNHKESRWERAHRERKLEQEPILDLVEYVGSISIDWDTIYNDLKSLDKWTKEDWATWNWRQTEFKTELPFPETESTKSIDLTLTQFYSTIRSGLISDSYPPVKQILDQLNIYMPAEYAEHSACRIHRQMPGQMLWMHYDFSADGEWDHYFVYLNDWTPGQVSLFGTKALTNWKSGDVYKINGHLTPHGAANCGYGERWMATIKGKKIVKLVDNQL